MRILLTAEGPDRDPLGPGYTDVGTSIATLYQALSFYEYHSRMPVNSGSGRLDRFSSAPTVLKLMTAHPADVVSVPISQTSQRTINAIEADQDDVIRDLYRLLRGSLLTVSGGDIRETLDREAQAAAQTGVTNVVIYQDLSVEFDWWGHVHFGAGSDPASRGRVMCRDPEWAYLRALVAGLDVFSRQVRLATIAFLKVYVELYTVVEVHDMRNHKKSVTSVSLES